MGDAPPTGAGHQHQHLLQPPPLPLSPHVRRVLVEWMGEMCAQLGLGSAVLFSAVAYLDCFSAVQVCVCACERKRKQRVCAEKMRVYWRFVERFFCEALGGGCGDVSREIPWPERGQLREAVVPQLASACQQLRGLL